MDLQVAQNERRRGAINGAQQVYDRHVRATDRQTQADTAKRAAALRRYGLAASDSRARRACQFFQPALQIGGGDRIAVALEGDVAGACPCLQFGKLGLQLQQRSRAGVQPLRQHAFICQRPFALAVHVKQRCDEQQVTGTQHKAEKRQCENPAGTAGRECCDRIYGATSAVIVKISAGIASIRVTGAAKLGLRSRSLAANAPMRREAPPDRPLNITFCCCWRNSVR